MELSRLDLNGLAVAMTVSPPVARIARLPLSSRRRMSALASSPIRATDRAEADRGRVRAPGRVTLL